MAIKTARVRQVATAAASGLALLAAGCVSPSAGSGGFYAAPIGDAPVTSNPTPYSAALYCLADWARANGRVSPRIAVGRISDYTGAVSDNGRAITQGASLFAMTALGKAGARQVERYDTSVAEMELRYANSRLLGDGEVGENGEPADYRRIIAGSVPGSDFIIQGGITELNYNIRSAGLEVGGSVPEDDDTQPAGGLITGRLYVMNVALDLRLVDTRTQEVVDLVSYQKQIIGREVSAGVFDFLNGNIFDISAGDGGLEPVQLAVRSLVERSIVEFMANLYGAPGPEVCLSAENDPLGPNGPTGGYYPAYDTLDTNNGETRADPDRWHDRRDRDVRRGRY